MFGDYHQASPGFDPALQIRFEDEAGRLRTIIGTAVVGIDRGESMATDGTEASAVLEIYVSVSSLSSFAPALPGLRDAGYVLRQSGDSSRVFIFERLDGVVRVRIFPVNRRALGL